LSLIKNGPPWYNTEDNEARQRRRKVEREREKEGENDSDQSGCDRSRILVGLFGAP